MVPEDVLAMVPRLERALIASSHERYMCPVTWAQMDIRTSYGAQSHEAHPCERVGSLPRGAWECAILSVFYGDGGDNQSEKTSCCDGANTSP